MLLTIDNIELKFLAASAIFGSVEIKSLHNYSKSTEFFCFQKFMEIAAQHNSS